MKFYSAIAVLCSCVWLSATAIAQDMDEDGIDDAFEQRLLQLYAPCIRLDVMRNAPETGVGVPTSITRLIKHCSINFYVDNDEIVLHRPTNVRDAIDFISVFADGGEQLSLRHVVESHIWGFSDLPGGRADWPTAISRNDGLYGRVWRPWANAYPDVYSVQYYVFITYNETSFSGDEGNHEGDWICADLCVDARANAAYPTILHMVLHVHGRQTFSTPSAIEFAYGHPAIYLENGTNEPWPNSGESASWASRDNWPRRDGFASNKNFDFEDSSFVSEDSITRDHTGEGNEWRTWLRSIPNIGDNGISLCGDEGEFILVFAGRYGDRSEGTFYEGDPPNGPPYQDSFWRRVWDLNRNGQSLGPWPGASAVRVPGDDPDPFQYPYVPCVIGGSYSYCLWPSAQHSFGVPTRPSIGQGLTFWAVENGPLNVEGTPSLPFGTIESGLINPPNGSTVFIRAGSSSFRGTISTALTLRAVDGRVTIGE